jgi:hypothetical protein
MIFRPDRNEVWMVNPAEKKYMVFPIDEKKGQLEKWNGKEKKCKISGQRKVSALNVIRIDPTKTNSHRNNPRYHTKGGNHGKHHHKWRYL